MKNLKKAGSVRPTCAPNICRTPSKLNGELECSFKSAAPSVTSRTQKPLFLLKERLLNTNEKHEQLVSALGGLLNFRGTAFSLNLELLGVTGITRKRKHFIAESGFHYIFCRFKESPIHFTAHTAIASPAHLCQGISGGI